MLHMRRLLEVSVRILGPLLVLFQCGTASAGPVPAASPPQPQPSYEELRRSAVETNLAMALEPLFARCTVDSDLHRRQCEMTRQWLADQIRTTRYVAIGDSASLQVAPYDAAEKSVALTVTGCVACDKPLAIDGDDHLVATRAPKTVKGNSGWAGIDLAQHEVAILDVRTAQRWAAKILPRLRVEYIFTVGGTMPIEKKTGIAVTPIAHRIFDRCTGEVLASEPASRGPVAAATNDPTCPKPGELSEEELADRAEQAKLPATLTRRQIEQAMGPAQTRVSDCANEFDLEGVARVSFVLLGNGISEFKVLPPFDEGDANLCIRAAMKMAVFPRFKRGTKIPVEYPFVMRKSK